MPRTEVRETRSVSMWPLSRTRTPAVNSPRSEVQGTPPRAISAWLPSISSPEVRVTTTPSAVRRAPAARERERTVTPRRAKASSSTSAASASVPGSTFSREETRVTSLPRAR